jgi:mercuric ion transport protein
MIRRREVASSRLHHRGSTVKRVSGYLLTATALVACPCHLVVTLLLVLGLLGGTALGAVLAANAWLVVVAATLYFALALGAGLYLLGHKPRHEGR